MVLLDEMLQNENTLPTHNYESKEIICPIGIEYKGINACPNDCILYKK